MKSTYIAEHHFSFTNINLFIYCSSSGEEEIDEDIDIPKVVNCDEDEDDFEKEMMQELDKKVVTLEEMNEIGL